MGEQLQTEVEGDDAVGHIARWDQRSKGRAAQGCVDGPLGERAHGAMRAATSGPSPGVHDAPAIISTRTVT